MTDQDLDLGVPVLPLMSWTPESSRTNVDRLYEWVEHLAVDAIDWYMTEKKRKARWSRRLRALAAILATAGGAVPVAALAAGRPAAGNWGVLLLALAAGCIGYDRFFGYSSAWLRYLAAATALRARLVDFQLSWAARAATQGDAAPGPDRVAELVGAVRGFAAEVNEIVQSETDAWLSEFGNRLSELEARLQQQSVQGRR